MKEKIETLLALAADIERRAFANVIETKGALTSVEWKAARQLLKAAQRMQREQAQ